MTTNLLSEHKPTRTRRPEASQTSPSGMSSTIQVHQVTHMRVSRDLRGERLTRKQRGSSPWHFWSNSPSRSGIFYLYYCSNTLCKCNMKSTITQRTDVSLKSAFVKCPTRKIKTGFHFFLLRTLFSKHGKLFPVGSNCQILLKPGILISQLSL